MMLNDAAVMAGKVNMADPKAATALKLVEDVVMLLTSNNHH